jgi:hypothetical protein
VPTPTILDFTSAAGSGTCGQTQNGTAMTIRTLDCGKLYLGGSSSSLTPNATPDGGVNRYALSCSGSSCTIGPTSTAPGLNTADPDCTNTGCNFGTPLPVPASSATCVINTFASPAGGTLDLTTGVASQTVNLNSAVFLSGNLTNPCPQCSATGTPSSPGTGTCNKGARVGLTCKTTNSTGLTRDCPPGGSTESPFGSINVVLGSLANPLTTGTASQTSATGNFCPGQGPGGPPNGNNISGFPGCFGSSGSNGGGSACRTIIENGVAAVHPIVIGTPANVTLASTFCVPLTTNISVNIVGDLPGPGATTLTGTYTTH